MTRRDGGTSWTKRARAAAMGVATIVMALTIGGLAATPTHAEISDPLATGAAGTPIEIQAEDGIEWRRNENVYVARGNATVRRGDLLVHADSLTAHYRKRAGGGSEIWLVEAAGHVTISSPGRTVQGDKAVYDLDDRVLRVTGEGLRITTDEEIVTAEDSLEYRERERTVIARGNATVAQGERRVRADTMVGFFEQLADKSLELVRVTADGNVQLKTKNTIARSAKADYDLRAEIVTLGGGVKVTSDENQLNGDNAEVNLKTGVSRLLGGADGSGKVKSLIIPSAEPNAP
ncbi:MAG: LptA/OstA family protein [Dongiaceae bacterium]